MKFKSGAMCILISMAVFFSGSTLYANEANEAFGYKLKTDIAYGKGIVTTDGEQVSRDLLMDIYQPLDSKKSVKKPAVVLIHGGAFQQGGRRRPPYREMGAVHSRMEDYARLLAPMGYVCFVIEYRLTPEDPIPSVDPAMYGVQTIDETVSDAGLARVNFARGHMGLLPIKSDEKFKVWNATMSAAEDLKKAVKYVQKVAEDYGVDPKRIAVGGHSAGATTVLNATYGLKAPVKAAFPLSPAVGGFDFGKVIDSPDLPALLLVVSQNDDPAILEGIPSLIATAREKGLNSELVWVPGFPHFYPTGAVSLSDDGTRTSIGERVVDFLEKNL